jgi:hypothetical protein
MPAFDKAGFPFLKQAPLGIFPGVFLCPEILSDPGNYYLTDNFYLTIN